MQQNITKADHFPKSLQAKAAALEADLRKTIAKKCQRLGVSKEITAVFIEDALQIVYGTFNGLNATTEQIRQFTKAAPYKAWKDATKIELSAPAFISQYYEDILNALSGMPSIGNPFLTSPVTYELLRRRSEARSQDIYEGMTTQEEALETARRLFLSYSTSIIGEATDATKEELQAVKLVGFTETPERRRRSIALAMQAQEQRKLFKPQRKRKSVANTKTREKSLPLILGDPRAPVAIFQTIAKAMGDGIEVAPIEAEALVQPLRAELDRIPDTDPSKPSADAIYKALDALQVVPRKYTYKEKVGDMYRYEIPSRTLVTLATLQSNPNNRQIVEFFKGLAFIEKHTQTIHEDYYVRKKDKDGKWKLERKKKLTTLHPVVMRTRSFADIDKDTGREILRPGTEVTILDIQQLFVDGRSAEKITELEDGKKHTYKLAASKTQNLDVGQFALWQTPEEKKFRSILISRGQKEENDLMAAVFDYKGRRKICANREAAALEALNAARNNGNSTQKDIEQAEDAWRNAEMASRDIEIAIKKHIDRDYKKLADMFKLAQDAGILITYSRSTSKTITPTSKYGAGYVWKWKRFPDYD